MNLDDFLDSKDIIKKQNNIKIFLPVIVILIVIFAFIIFLVFHDDEFTFKTLAPSCDDFKLYGSIAYSDKKSSIHISNITYCGEEEDNLYSEIECSLYEVENNRQIKISTYSYNEMNSITLSEFLEKVDFVIDDYDKTCRVYKEGSLVLEIEAKDQKGKVISYKIPLKLQNNCVN